MLQLRLLPLYIQHLFLTELGDTRERLKKIISRVSRGGKAEY